MINQLGLWRCLKIFIQIWILCLSMSFVYSTDVVITDEDGHKLPDVIGPINEGSHLSLVCETNGDSPSVVTWWKGPFLLDDSFVTMPRGKVRNRLMVSSLHRNDYMTAFTCQAALPNITKPSETSVSVDLNLRPLDVHITSLQRPLSAGREVQLTCQSRGSRPPAILTWWLGSQQLLNSRNTSFNSISESTLLYVPSMVDHKRVLSCRASNPVLNGNILEDHWVLNIYYVPRLLVTVGTPQSNIKEGDDVYFDCNVQANPAVTEVGWKFNEKTIFTQLLSGIKINNQSLLLRQITKKNTGHYTCIAANVEGEGVSKNVWLDVKYTPYCKSNQKLSYGVPLHSSIEVKCSVHSNPDDLIFEWYFNNSIVQVPLRHFTENGSDSILVFSPKKKTDYGHLFCRAHNSIGYQKEPCCFKISPASVPAAVENCEVDNETLNTVQVSCEPGYNGGLSQMFHLELYNTKGLQANLFNESVPIFNVTNIPSGISYIVVVFATNSLGRSNSVAFTARTLPYPDEKEDIKPMLISPLLGALIAIVGSLVLIAIVIVIGVRHHESDSITERTIENPHQLPYPYELGSSIGELKPGQYI